MSSRASFAVVATCLVITAWEFIYCNAFVTLNRSLNNVLLSSSAVPDDGRSRILFMDYDSGGGDFFDESFDDDEEDNENENDGLGEYTDDDFPAELFEDFIPKLNIVTLSGRVGQDPQPRYFDDGKVVLNLSLAVKRKYHPMERAALEITQEETDWFQLELWGRDAEYAANFVTKGCRVGITGSLVVNHWKDRNSGEERSSPKILCRHLDILETKAESALRQSGNRGSNNFGDNDSYGYGAGGNRNDDENDTMSAGSGGFFD